jgi:PDZ domain-containing secreted protein
MNASEQVSILGVEMRVDARKAEREIQGLLVISVQTDAEAVSLHERDDLIIAVDSKRVTNFADLCEQMRLVQPGEIVYLSILRDGHRVQVPIQVRSAVPPVQDWVR